MKAKINIDINFNGEKGVDFIGENNESLYFIPNRHLDRLEHNYKLLNEEKGTVLTQVIRIAKFNWASKEILNELTKIIHDRNPDIEVNILADTFSAVLLFNSTNKIWDQYNKDNPYVNFSDSKAEWKNQFWQYLKNNSNL